MTKAEIQRLATALHQLVRQDESFLDTYGVIIGAFASFVFVVAATRIEAYFSNRDKNRAILKVSRQQLYEALVFYRDIFKRIEEAKKSSTALNNGQIIDDIVRARLKIADNLNSSDDRKYARLVAKIILFDREASTPERVERLDRIIRKLERDVTPLWMLLDKQAQREKEGIEDEPGRIVQTATRIERWLRRRV